MSYVHITGHTRYDPCIFVIFFENRFCENSTFVLQTIDVQLNELEVVQDCLHCRLNSVDLRYLKTRGKRLNVCYRPAYNNPEQQCFTLQQLIGMS